MGLILIVSINFGFIFNRLDFEESNLLKLKVVNICMRLPSEKIPSYFWTSLDYEIEKIKFIDRNQSIDFYTAILVTCGDKILRNNEQSLILFESVKLEDTKLLINSLKGFISRHQNKNISDDEILMLEQWIEYFDVKLTARSDENIDN